MAKCTPLDVAVVDVGDLQLAPAGGRETVHDLENTTVVEVAAGHGQVALRLGRLLYDAHDPLLLQRGHTEALRFVDLLEQDHRSLGVGAISVHSLTDGGLEDVVAQDHADGIAVAEVLGETEGLGDSPLSLLVGVVQPS